MNEYTILGTAIPQGSKSVTRTGLMFDANKNLKAWRKHASDTIAEQHGTRPTLDAPLAVRIHVRLAKPKTVKRIWPSVKPDIDKLARAILDSAVSAGVIRDDALVCDLRIIKEYTQHAALVKLRIWDMTA